MDMPPTGPSKEEGLRLLKAGQLDEAIAVFEDVVKTQSEDAQLHTYLGVAYNQKGDRLRGISHFEESLRLMETPQSYYNLGQVYETVHRVDEAVRQYRMAVEMDPGYTMAQQAMDRLHAKYEAEHPQPQPEPEPDAEQTLIGAGAWPGAEQTQAMPRQAASQPAPTMYGAPPPVGPPGLPPELADRQRKKEEEVANQQKLMMKSGLIYGIICGAIIVPAVYFGLGRFLGFPIPGFALEGNGLFVWLGLLSVIGAVVGLVIGLWVGYTCGGENAGLQAGAALGVSFGLIIGLIGGSSGVMVVVTMIMFGMFGCVNGYLIGMLVDRSIGWD